MAGERDLLAARIILRAVLPVAKVVLDQVTRSFAARQYNQARDQLSQLLSDPGKRTRDVLKLDNDLKTLGY